MLKNKKDNSISYTFLNRSPNYNWIWSLLFGSLCFIIISITSIIKILEIIKK
jgi:hypothetical protein